MLPLQRRTGGLGAQGGMGKGPIYPGGKLGWEPIYQVEGGRGAHFGTPNYNTCQSAPV